MTIKQIAAATAVALQADDIAELLDGDEIDVFDSDVKTLVKCVNMAAAELCLNGFPRCITQTVTAVRGLIAMSEFDTRPSVIRSVTRQGSPVRFTFDMRGIAVNSDGAYEVCYSVVSSDGNLDDEIELGAGVDENVVTYLTARNYCIVTGRNDEAQVWDRLYVGECERRRIARRARIRPRVWI